MRKKDRDKMSGVAARAERIIRHEMISRGVKKPEARRIVARAVGVAPGSIERLCNGTLVHVERITERLNAYAIRRIESEIARLEHELAIARLSARRPDDADIARAEAALNEARKAIGL